MIKKQYCTDANKLSRAWNSGLLLTMIESGGIGGSGLLMLTWLAEKMNKNNRVRYKLLLKEYKLSKRGIERILKSLQEAYFLYKYKDGHIMLNPNVVCMTKYRNAMWYLREIWAGRFVVYKSKCFIKEEVNLIEGEDNETEKN